ncbi:MAG TPA: substrate-binding domain-containing protein [Kineosporiaceae bacterium]|jgi:ribose transport system substrate-binding protein|nr:substrate-binding domain-containing protein [Kineosporiaceae bacterium]
MISRRTFAGTAGALAAAAVLAACGGSSPSSSPGTSTAAGGAAAGGAKKIAIVSPYLSQQPATKEVVDKFTADAKAKGWDVSTVDTNNDFAKMNTEITRAVNEKVAAVVLGMGDPKQLGPGLAAAKAANIPVIGLDAGVADGVTANVTSDNKFLGETSAKAMADAIGGKGSVLMFTYDDFEPVRVRGQAAKAWFQANGITVIDYIRIDAPNGLADAKAKAKDALAKYPAGKISGIWSAWDQAANGAYQAVEAANRGDVKVTGVDGQDFAVAAINKGGPWVATVKQDWSGIAAKAVETLDGVLGGTKPGQPQILVPGQLITKS